MAFGLGPLLAGLDKFTNILVNWQQYLNPKVLQFVPVTSTTFMQLVGVIEIIAGIAVLMSSSRVFAYVVMLWLIGIAVNLLTTGMFYDLAMRDVEIALGAFALSQLTAVREAQATARP